MLERARALGAIEPAHYLLPANLSHHSGRADQLYGSRGYDPALPQETLRTAWRSLCKETGKRWKEKYPKDKSEPFKQLRFHDTRHSFVTFCAESGISLEMTMALSGHLSAAMSRHYTHLRDATLREVVDKVGGSFGMEAPQSLLEAKTTGEPN